MKHCTDAVCRLKKNKSRFDFDTWKSVCRDKTAAVRDAMYAFHFAHLLRRLSGETIIQFRMHNDVVSFFLLHKLRERRDKQMHMAISLVRNKKRCADAVRWLFYQFFIGEKIFVH